MKPTSKAPAKAQSPPSAVSQSSVSDLVVQIPLEELHSFAHHPFKVRDDERMQETAESIREHGVLVPAIARPRPEGGYELISGHRRKHASELAGLKTMPVVVRNLNDDEATIVMVDSNLQREQILPSERAFAYKLKLEALKHQGKRQDLTSPQLGEKSQSGAKSGWAVSQVAEKTGDSRTQVQRFIRLTNLIPPALEKVDEKKLAFNPAVEISYLKPDEQSQLLEAMDVVQAPPSLSQAQRMRRYSELGTLTPEKMTAILLEVKKPPLKEMTSKDSFLNRPEIRKHYPKHFTEEQIAKDVIKCVEAVMKARKKQRSGPDR